MKFIALAIALGATFPVAAGPNLVTSDDDYKGPLLDLTGVSTKLDLIGNSPYLASGKSVSLPGGITLTAFPGGGGYLGLGSTVGQGLITYGLSDNGKVGPSSATYIGLNSGTGYAELEFATAVSSFGGYWNYWRGVNTDTDPVEYFFDGNTPTLSAFRADDTLIASYDLFAEAPINTPPGSSNQFAFRGIVSDAADIKYLQFGGSYMVLAGTADGSLIAAPIPEPETYAMLLAGLGMLALITRRRKLA